jgi:uncharacterized protein
MLTTPGPTQRKKARNPLRGVVCLLTTGVLISVRLYTVEEVLAEFLTFCSTAGAQVRTDAAHAVRHALHDTQWTVFPQSHTSFLDALTLYESRPDKEYSLTDCIAMHVMRSEGITEVLTNDHHFTQEGFQILFR